MLRRSILFAVLLIVLVSQRGWAQRLLQQPYHPRLHKGTVAAFLADIRKQTGVSISYASSVVDSNKKVKVPVRTADLAAILEDILQGQAVEATESNGGILLVPRTVTSNAAGHYRIATGRLREKGSGEVIIGASVYDPDLQVGTTTNSYGLYQLAIPEGERRLCIAYVGYKPDTLWMPASGNVRRDLDLVPIATIAEVKVVQRDKGTPGERLRLTPADFKGQPQALGESDPMRSLQLQPGVQAGVDGSSGVIVRGGDPGQNLHLFDGVPLYFVDHFFGLTSVYNSEALKAVDFYKGAFPARYGGRLSSVIDVHGRDGDLQHLGGQASVGLLKASANLEGPIIKDKVGFMVSGRRSWIDGPLSAVREIPEAYFYDLNAKAHWVVNENHRLYVGFYTGRDLIRFTTGNTEQDAYMRVRWNNTVGSVRWNAVISPKLLFNATGTYSYFQFDQKDRVFDVDSAGKLLSNFTLGKSAIRDAALNLQFQWTPGRGHRVQLGSRVGNANFAPSSLDRISGISSISDPLGDPFGSVSTRFKSTELTVYAEDAIRLGESWTIRPGLHMTAWLSGDFKYTSFQPRFYAAYRPKPRHTVYASLSRMGQFLHLLSNNSFGLSSDFWVPSTARIRPEEAWQGTLGWAGNWKKTDFNIEAYYKDVDGVMMVTTGRSLFDNSNGWQDKVEQGQGWGYGAEVAASKSIGPFTASLAYTLSWNWRQFEGLNDGKKFPYRYDRRHNLNTRLSYAPNKRFDAVVQWMFLTGEAFTLPDQLYADLNNNLNTNNIPFGGGGSQYTYNYTDWNAYRLPDVHRMDVGVNFTKYRGSRYSRIWSLGVFNVYGRPNVSFVTIQNDDQGDLKLQGVSIFQFIPYVSLKVKF
jgi:hypothetical protein